MKKAFLIPAALCGIFFGPASPAAAEDPILRAGIMTDTHIGQTAESCAHVRKAFEIFRAQKADLVIHLGDIANDHSPSGYRHYRRIFNEVFPEPRPAELFVFAGHDARGFRGTEEEAYKAVAKEIGAWNPACGRLVLKGYPFLVFQEAPKLRRYEEAIAGAEKEFPGKPIFVLDHEPPVDTTYHSLFWGSRKLRTVLERHPRVVQFTGHAHGSVRDERNIWQGKFTSISAGCLQRWDGMLVGAPAYGKKSDGMLLLEVYPGKLVIRRFEYLTGREYGAGKRWIVPLPFDGKTAPYAPERRSAALPVPEFVPGAALKTAFEPAGLRLRFPEASDGVAEYRIGIEKAGADGKWIPFARHDQFSGFYLHKPPKEWKILLNRGYFESGRKYRVTVAPMGFGGRYGKELATVFTAPAFPENRVVFDCADPMKELPFKSLRKGQDLPHQEGFYLLKTPAELTLPDGIWKGAPKNARFRLIADIRFRQSARRPWALWAFDPKNRFYLTVRICTVPGDAGMMRYATDFQLDAPGDGTRCVIKFAGGDPGLVRFGRIRVERIR